MSVYLLVFATSLAAATVLPFYSEFAVIGAVAKGYWPWGVLLVATFGNTLGAGVNWGIGRYLLHWRHKRWFPFSDNALERAQSWFQRYGVWTLLLAWLPVGGDALTFIAGVMRVRFPVFFILTFIGKSLRYALVIGLAGFYPT